MLVDAPLSQVRDECGVHNRKYPDVLNRLLESIQSDLKCMHVAGIVVPHRWRSLSKAALVGGPPESVEERQARDALLNQPFSSAAREFPTELLDHWRELDDAVSKRLLKQVLGATRHILDRWYYRAPPPPGSDVPSSWDYLLAKLVEGEFQSNVTELPGVVTSYPVQDRNNRASVLLYAVLNRPPHSVLDRFLSDPLTEGEGGLYGEHHALPKGLEEAVVFYGLNHFLTVQMPRQVPPELPGDFSRTVCKN